MMYIYHEILPSNINEWTDDSCNNISEPHRHYVEQNKPDRKEYILYDFIYIRY